MVNTLSNAVRFMASSGNPELVYKLARELAHCARRNQASTRTFKDPERRLRVRKGQRRIPLTDAAFFVLILHGIGALAYTFARVSVWI